MTSDQLAVERAAWAVTLRREFERHTFSYREHLNDYQTIFLVTHADTPGWKAKVTLCSAHRLRNRIEVNDTALVHSCTSAGMNKLLALLEGLRLNFTAKETESKEKEASAAKWQQRQETELAGLADLKGVDVEIIRRGPNAGSYAVALQPGNALEHLTLEQFKAFHAFIRSL